MNKKLKIIPGRSIDGRGIKARLKNRTLQPQIHGDEDYTLNEDMARFTRLSKVEQLNEMRENNKKIQGLQQEMDKQQSDKKKRQEEQRIENMAKKRMEEMAKQQLNNGTEKV